MVSFFEENEYIKPKIQQLFDIKNISNSFEEASIILIQQLDPILDDFKKYYVLHKKNPNNQEFSNIFLTNQSYIEKLISQAIKIKNEIEKKTLEINNIVEIIDVEIYKEKTKNKLLKKKLYQTNDQTNGSNEMINDYKNTYNLTRFDNITTIIGTLILIFFIVKIMTKKPNVSLGNTIQTPSIK
jgi:hypothetical protein